MKPTPELIDAVAKSCGNAEVVEKLLACALAACALEEARAIKQELESIKEPTMLSAWTVAKSIVRERIAWHEREAERAVEEKLP